MQRALEILVEDPFHPSLRTHRLKGELAGVWACTVDYRNRLLFEIVRNPSSGAEEILLLTMGTHEEVY
ncbi:TPA: type II toxin-antitoxin system mRNA interferase toxin, RelE/StbE family [Candidatus Acetothermia bacterium]|nr:type II toxin-antitoxin system mRNA interferase toxin, RelE/StbE family [Candidatus Acetothermia bacterium]